MADSEKKLIRAVKRHGSLYKKEELGFRDRVKRERAWNSVAVECGLPGKYILVAATCGCVCLHDVCVCCLCFLQLSKANVAGKH